MAEDRLKGFVGYVKVFNVVAGVALIAGTLTLVGLVVKRTLDGGRQTAGVQEVLIPADATLIDTALGDGAILLTLRRGDGSTTLLRLDAQSGKRLGSLDLVQAP